MTKMASTKAYEDKGQMVGETAGDVTKEQVSRYQVATSVF